MVAIVSKWYSPHPFSILHMHAHAHICVYFNILTVNGNMLYLLPHITLGVALFIRHCTWEVNVKFSNQLLAYRFFYEVEYVQEA